MNRFSTFAETNGLRPADVLMVPKSQLRVVTHFIVYLGKDNLGRDLYMDNNNVVGVRRFYENTLFAEFSGRFDVRPFRGSDGEREMAKIRAFGAEGTSYDLSNFNCEHFANFVQTGNAYSRQVSKAREGIKTMAVVAGIAMVLGAVFGD
jgi:hypothetical protein